MDLGLRLPTATVLYCTYTCTHRLLLETRPPIGVTLLSPLPIPVSPLSLLGEMRCTVMCLYKLFSNRVHSFNCVYSFTDLTLLIKQIKLNDDFCLC